MVDLIKNGDAFRHPGVYKIINTKTGKIYVGSSLDMRRRFYEHFRLLKLNKHHCHHLQRSFDKHGEECFDVEVIEVINIDGMDLPERDNALLVREQFWMDKTKCYTREYGYNSSTEAGRISMTEEIKTKLRKRQLGKRHTEESRLKMSIAHKGRTVSEETRRKLSDRKHSEESKAKISKAHKGKRVSEETRRKLSIAGTGKKATLETRAKMSAAHSDRRHTEESKAKISKVHKGKIVSEETRRKLSIAGKRYAENKRRLLEEQKLKEEQAIFNS